MALSLPPTATQDQYNDRGASVRGQLFARFTFYVSNAPVFYQLRANHGGLEGDWDPEERYVPAAAGLTLFMSIDRQCFGIRFRSAVAGKPAVVTSECILPSELPKHA